MQRKGRARNLVGVLALVLLSLFQGCSSERTPSSDAGREGTGTLAAQEGPAGVGTTPQAGNEGLTLRPQPPDTGAPVPNAPPREGRAESSGSATVVEPGIDPAAPRAADRSDLDPTGRVDDPPEAPMGNSLGTSALANAPGYVPPDDPEAESVVRGRREVPRRNVTFADGLPSAEDLARAILAALRSNDTSALQRLKVTKEQFADILWPEMPASRPITNTRAEDAWFFVDAGNHSGIHEALGNWGGQDLAFVRLEYRRGRAVYTNYNLYEEVAITARTQAGEEVVIDGARTFAECGGAWKVYSFKD